MSTFYFFSAGIAACSGLARRALPILLARALRRHLSPVPPLRRRRRAVRLRVAALEWYLVRGRADDALRVVRAIASANGRRVPDDFTLKFDDEDDEEEGKSVESSAAASASIVDVIRSPNADDAGPARARGAHQPPVLGGVLRTEPQCGQPQDQPLRQRALQLRRRDAGLPAHRAAPRPLRLGIGTMLLSGVACTAGRNCMNLEFKVLRMTCGVVGIFGVAATYDLLLIYTAELFPTVLRNVALGCTAQAAQLGDTVAPMVVVLRERVPFAVIGASRQRAGFLLAQDDEQASV
ncbi:hypothetical protein EJB05_38153, partial [Eragrostis curvula]